MSPQVRRVFLDTEFLEDGKTIELISIALVERDQHFYAVSSEFPLKKAVEHPFVGKQVLPLLPSPSTWVPKAKILEGVKEFIGDPRGMEIWADFASYDWVVFCQLFGAMVDKPRGYPWFVHEFRMLLNGKKPPRITGIEGQPHDALYDARVLQAQFYAVMSKDA